MCRGIGVGHWGEIGLSFRRCCWRCCWFNKLSKSQYKRAFTMKQKDMLTNGCLSHREGVVYGREWVIFATECIEPLYHEPMEIGHGKNLYKSSG